VDYSIGQRLIVNPAARICCSQSRLGGIQVRRDACQELYASLDSAAKFGITAINPDDPNGDHLPSICQ
jgi:hypothetical protein